MTFRKFDSWTVFILLAGIVSWLCASDSCRAQPRRQADRQPGIVYGDRVFAEAAQLPWDAGAQGIVAVFVRVADDFVVYRRNVAAHPDSVFQGGMEISMELLDSAGNIAASTHERILVAAGNYEQTESRDSFTLVRRLIAAVPGKYTAVVHVEDAASSRKREFSLPVLVKTLDGPAPVLASLLPVEADSSAPQRYSAAGFGGSVPYARKALVAVSASAAGDAVWKWTIKDRRGDRVRVLAGDRIHPVDVLSGVSTAGEQGAVARFSLAQRATSGASMFIFEFPFDTLDAGEYHFMLEAETKSGRDSISQPLRIYWKDMPLTLRNPELALAVMWHILTEDEDKELRRGPDEELYDRIRAWWKAKNPSPGSARNAAMEEYFRRADHAFYAFQTLSRNNGALTDRGKIYMLFGPPDDTRRELKRGEPAREIWRYTSLDRTFIFIDRDRNGDYRLPAR